MRWIVLVVLCLLLWFRPMRTTGDWYDMDRPLAMTSELRAELDAERFNLQWVPFGFSYMRKSFGPAGGPSREETRRGVFYLGGTETHLDRELYLIQWVFAGLIALIYFGLLPSFMRHLHRQRGVVRVKHE